MRLMIFWINLDHGMQRKDLIHEKLFLIKLR